MWCFKLAILYSAVWCSIAKVTKEEYALLPEIFHLDDFDRCLMLGKNALFCTVQLQLMPVDPLNSHTWKIIQELIVSKKNYRQDWLRYGICVPLSCPEMRKNISSYMNNTNSLREGIGDCYSSKFKHLGLAANVTAIECETEKPLYEIDGCDITVGIFLIILVLVVGLSSLYEGTARYKSKEDYDAIVSTKYGRLISCFSIPKNWERLKAKNTNPDAKALRVINGVRFYSIFLVVMCHVCMVGFVLFPSNPQFASTMTEDPINMLFLNGNYCVQMFLVMSSFLLSYHFFTTFEKRPKFKLTYILYAFIHRYIRLTTCLMVVIAINATWIRHLNRGPFWDRTVGVEYRNCRKNWWTNLLYINNYYDVDNMCMLQTWYLACDTQMFLYALIVLAIVWKYKKYVFWIFSASVIFGALIPGVLTYVGDYDILLRQYPESLYQLLKGVPEWISMYIPGHNNIGGYSVGLIGGYLFYKNKNKQIITKKYHVILWWVVTWTFPLSVIFVGVPLYYDSYVPTRIGAAVYGAFARNLYATGMCVAIFGISQNVGWLLRDAIVIPPFQFLGRLTYCVYLVHTTLIRVRAGQSRSKSYMTIYTFLFETCGELVLAHVFAIILCLFVELPTSALQKLLTPQLKRETNAVLKRGYVEDKELEKNSDLEISRV